jgi:hypothetical protein
LSDSPCGPHSLPCNDIGTPYLRLKHFEADYSFPSSGEVKYALSHNSKPRYELNSYTDRVLKPTVLSPEYSSTSPASRKRRRKGNLVLYFLHTKSMKMQLFATSEKTKPDIENTRGIFLTAVKLTTVHALRLPLQYELREFGINYRVKPTLKEAFHVLYVHTNIHNKVEYTGWARLN